MKKNIITIILAAATLPAYSSTLLVNFEGTNTTSPDYDTLVDGVVVSRGSTGTDTWNDFVNTTTSSTALVLSDNTASGVSLLRTDSFVIGTILRSGTGDFDGGVDINDDNGFMRSLLFGNGTLNLTGLNALEGNAYNLTIYSNQNNSNVDRSTDFTVGGVTKTTQLDSTNFAESGNLFTDGVYSVTFNNLSGDDLAIIVADNAADPGTGGLVAGFSITTVPVPEPSSTALLGLGGLALALRRRK